MSVPAKKAPLCDGSSQRQLSAEAQRFAKELTLSRCKKPETKSELCRFLHHEFANRFVSIAFHLFRLRCCVSPSIRMERSRWSKSSWASQRNGQEQVRKWRTRLWQTSRIFSLHCRLLLHLFVQTTMIVLVFYLREWLAVEVDACCVCICDIEEHQYHSTCKQLQATWLWKNIWLLWFEDRHVSWGQQSRQPGLQLNQHNVTEVLCHVGVFVTVWRNVLVFYGWYFRML